MKITIQQLEPHIINQYEKLFNSSSEKEVKEKAKVYHIENIIGGIAVTVFVNMVRINQFITIPKTVAINGKVKRYKMTVEVLLYLDHCETEAFLINHFNTQTIFAELIHPTLAFDEIMINGRKIIANV